MFVAFPLLMAEVGAQFQRRTVNECWVIVRRQFHLTVHPASQPLAFPPHDRKRPGRKRGDCAQGADPAIDQQEGFLNGVVDIAWVRALPLRDPANVEPTDRQQSLKSAAVALTRRLDQSVMCRMR